MSNSSFFHLHHHWAWRVVRGEQAGSPFGQRIKPRAYSLNRANNEAWPLGIRNGDIIQQKRNWRIAYPQPTLVTSTLRPEPATAQPEPVTHEVACPACRSSAKRKTKDYLAPAYERRSAQHPHPAPLGRLQPLSCRRSDFLRAVIHFNSRNRRDPEGAGHDCRVL